MKNGEASALLMRAAGFARAKRIISAEFPNFFRFFAVFVLQGYRIVV
ncbi:MAG: hypothetical protein ACI4O4_05110 [Candidatus Ventricola sp.]